MTFDVRVEVLGTVVRIVTDDARTAHLLRALLHDFARPSHRRAPEVCFDVRLERDGVTHVLEGSELDGTERGSRHPILGRLVSGLTAAAIARFPGLAVHAGVVSIGGCAVAIAAPSGVGKSTLTASCLLAGFDYVSDEALCLAPGTGVALPVPKPLALSGESAAMLGLEARRWNTKDLVPARALGAQAVESPVTVEHVVVLSRSGAGTSVPCRRPSAMAVSTLLAMAFNAYRDPVTSVSLASSAGRAARCWELDVGDPGVAAENLLHLVSRPVVAV